MHFEVQSTPHQNQLSLKQSRHDSQTMENILLLFTLLAWMTGFAVYVLSLKNLHRHATKNELAIFGHQYDSFATMGNSPYFLLRLWSGRLIDTHPDEVLVQRLNRSRRLLIMQMCFSIGLFFLVMLLAIFRS